MQRVDEINWYLEAARLLVPVASAVVLGWWIARRNELLKRDISKEISQFTIRDQLLHTRRLEVMAEVYPIAMEIHKTLMRFDAAESQAFGGLPNLSREVNDLGAKLQNVLNSAGYLLDKETAAQINGLAITAKSLRYDVVESDQWLKEVRELGMTTWRIAERLEHRFRGIVSPDKTLE